MWELDGFKGHRSELSFEDDRARDRALTASGLAPMRVTWSQFRLQADKLEVEIRETLDARRSAYL